MAKAYTPSAQVKLTNVAYVRLTSHGKRFEIAGLAAKDQAGRQKLAATVGNPPQFDGFEGSEILERGRRQELSCHLHPN